jgi:fructose-1,6-bisphosphatase/sedoheptulose 1,7-bisphosphatase-like protein
MVINGAIDECSSEQQIGELIAAVATFAAVTTNSLAQALGTSPEGVVAALATTMGRPA